LAWSDPSDCPIWQRQTQSRTEQGRLAKQPDQAAQVSDLHKQDFLKNLENVVARL